MPLNPADIWQPGPVQARIYPATRFVQTPGRAFLQLGVEFLDDMGDPVKAVGILRCELLESTPQPSRSTLRGGQAASSLPAPPGARLYGWELRLATPAEQASHWNPVTQCYELELTLDSFQVASRPSRVRVELEQRDRPTLLAEAQMQTLP